MILADKIINERKRNGWSQEELADKLSVSRQAVSKWESAQSVPDIQRVIQMAELFGVSTDYLLKEEYGVPDTVETTVYDYNEEGNYRVVSLEEANAFLDTKESAASKIARGVALCIMSPAPVILLIGLSEEFGNVISEGIATGVGVVALFIMIAVAVYTFISTGLRLKEYDFLGYDAIETAYGVKGIVAEKKKNFQDTFSRGIAIGVILCILSVIPVVVAGVAEAADYICEMMVVLLLIIVAAGVYTIIHVSTIMGSYKMLLQEGDYTIRNKEDNKKMSPIAGIYWSIITTIYLGWSFITGDWGSTWIIWPITGVFFGAVSGIYKCFSKN